MTTSNNCRFCAISRGDYSYNEVDVPFSSNDDFMALASIGALVEGWSLVIPKRHEMSMRSYYASQSFTYFANDVISKLTKCYGRIIAFEHGANQEGSITACGTDHAHLHLVPFTESLVDILKGTPLNWQRCYASEICSLAGQNEYLFYADIINEKWDEQQGYLHILEFPISQFFRKIIADRKGKTEVSDYKSFPHVDVAMKTRRVLAA